MFGRKTLAGAALSLAILGGGAGVASAAIPANLPSPGTDWEVTGNGAPYQTLGAWHDCLYVGPSAESQGATCSWSMTVGNTISGTLTVSVDTISESVGYSASTSYTTGASDTFTVPPNSGGGWVEDTSVYQTTPVFEAVAGDPVLGSATAYSNEYLAPTYQFAAS
jgi:hypothetical protein